MSLSLAGMTYGRRKVANLGRAYLEIQTNSEAVMIRRAVNPRVFLAKRKHQVSLFVPEQASVNSSPPSPKKSHNPPL